jgi:tetratricopeptide (TPR) repeat protein
MCIMTIMTVKTAYAPLMIFPLLLLASLLVVARADGAEPQSAFEKGVAEFNDENYEEALETFKAAYKETPTDARVTKYLGLTYLEIEDYKEAADFFRKTLELGPLPNEAEVRVYLAESLYEEGELKDALDSLLPALGVGDNAAKARAEYLHGEILARMNRNSEALAAFKKAEALDPELKTRADFQAAVIYYRLKNFKSAEPVFREIASTMEGSDWAFFSSEYLEAIKSEPSRFMVNLGVGFQYDDNVLAVPLDQSLVNLKKQGDWKRVFTLYGAYDFLRSGPWDVRGAYDLYVSQYFRSDYNRDGGKVFSQDIVNHRVSILPTYSTASSITGLGISYSYLEVDYARYLQTLAVNPTFIWLLKKDNYLEAGFKFQRQFQDLGFYEKKFGFLPAKDEEREARNYSASVDFIRAFRSPGGAKGLADIRAEAEWNDADGRNWVYSAFRASAGVSYPFVSDRLKANLYAEVYGQIFQYVNSIYGVRRRDYTYTAQPSITYSLTRSIDLTLGYSYIRDESSIGVYKYVKNIYSGDVSYRFN